MSLIHWKSRNSIPVNHNSNDRLASLFSLQDEINRLFEDMFAAPRSLVTPFTHSAINVPSVDIIETETSYKVQAELPGLNAKQIEVSASKGTLTIKGEKTEEKEEKEGNYIRRESSSGQFLRTIALPDTADDEKAEANFKDGVLVIEIPKKADAKSSVRKINVNDAA